MECISEHACFGGVQGFYRHASKNTQTEMQFAVYQPACAKLGRVPVLFFLAGLTCSEETATIKAGAQQFACQLGMMLVMPDTSPRGLDLPGEHDDWEFGSAASFYVDATYAPWSSHYRMESYLMKELYPLIQTKFPGKPGVVGITGHSMGGHGALMLALKYPDKFASVSAFAPIAHPSETPWGQKAFREYFGDDQSQWSQADATSLVQTHHFPGKILIDQGANDPYLAEQLRTADFVAACKQAGQDCEMRLQAGYDHGYYFVQTFLFDHLQHHAIAFAQV